MWPTAPRDLRSLKNRREGILLFRLSTLTHRTTGNRSELKHVALATLEKAKAGLEALIRCQEISCARQHFASHGCSSGMMLLPEHSRDERDCERAGRLRASCLLVQVRMSA